MRLWLDPARMAARGISASDVAAAIQTNNYQSAPGQAKGFYTVTNVSTNTGLTDVDQFENMVVKAKSGAVVRMRDIATVDLAAQSWTSSVMMNGQHAVFIGIQATPSGNPLTLVKGVRDLLPELQRNLPPAVQMQVAYNSTKFIQASIDEVSRTLDRGGGGHRCAGGVPVAGQPARGDDPAGHDTAVAGRIGGFDAGRPRFQHQPADPARDGAGDRAGGRRRHRGGGECLSPHHERFSPVQAALVGAREIVGPVVAMTITLAAVYARSGCSAGLPACCFASSPSRWRALSSSPASSR